MNEYGKKIKKQMGSYMSNKDSIDKEVSDIQNAVHGIEVRGALAAGVTKSFDKSKQSEEKSKETEDRQISLENQFDEQIKNMTLEDPSSAEIVSARTAKDGTTYDTLKDRLDNLITVSKTEPNADFWYEDLGETPIDFDPQTVMIANAELNSQEPENTENFWFRSGGS